MIHFIIFTLLTILTVHNSLSGPKGPKSWTLHNGVYTAPSTIPNAGLGLFAGQAFKKNDFITEYAGTQIEVSKEDRDNLLNSGSWSHIFSLGRHRVIDGLTVPVPGKGAASFCNHNPSKLNAQLIIKAVGCQGLEERVFLKATQNINFGEEIFTSYQPNYFRRFRDNNPVEAQKFLADAYFGNDLKKVNDYVQKKDYASMAKYLNESRRKLPEWGELKKPPTEWSEELCKLTAFKYKIVDESHLDKGSISLLDENSAEYHSMLISYALNSGKVLSKNEDSPTESLHDNDRPNPRIITSADVHKLACYLRRKNFKSPGQFKRNRRNSKEMQTSVMQFLIWLYASRQNRTLSKPELRNMVKVTGHNEYPEHHEQLLLQYLRQYMPDKHSKTGGTVHRKTLRALTHVLQPGISDKYSRDILSVPQNVSGSEFPHKRWNVQSIRAFLERKGYTILPYSKNGVIDYWKTLRDTYNESNPEKYLNLLSEKAKKSKYDFGDIIHRGNSKKHLSIYFHPIEHVEKDSLTESIRNSNGNRNDQKYSNVDKKHYCVNAYQALFQHIHYNGLNPDIIEKITLLDSVYISGMLKEGYKGSLGDRSETIKQLLAIGISRECGQVNLARKTKINYLSEINRLVTLPKALFNEDTDDNHDYNNLCDILHKEGLTIRQNYHDNMDIDN